MSKSVRTVVVILSLLMMVAGVGCVALSRRATPASVDVKAKAYAVKSGIADVNDFDAWYPNVEQAGRLKLAVDAAHKVNQLELQQQIEQDNLQYSIHKNVVIKNYKTGLEREEQLFGEKGLLSLGLSLAGFGTLTGFVGLARKRPGDVTPQELGLAVEQATGKINGDLSEKEKQLIEVVKGVQKFIDTYRDTTDNKEAVMIKTLKELASKAQDTNTQVAVATIKKQIV